MLEYDFPRDSERALCLQQNSLPCQHKSCQSSNNQCKCELSSISDGGSVTWYEPLPVKTVLSAGDDPTPAEMKIFEGHPASLSWNFSFTSLTLFAVTIKFEGLTLATSGPGGLAASVKASLEDKFNFTWISQRLTLVIFNVTTAYDESKGKFSCELTTSETGWIRKIQVKVVGKGKYFLT